ncbi:LysR family transcriptional regulator [Desulfitobacterium sp.]|uniref:LysR family transcriptional regulator n=1 Tax=Desulfitobacterium sp. TaxID=49981 RepID=UPI002B1EACF1|nr:LysR family transcriptional regulator [Desulfitobacterium sp.]MEA4901529.1 LysR family transcriptional regulator [Desulfitobacterium sp.]
MRIEDLRYFLEIEKTKSISNAAKRLFISQQGLSKALHCLEEEFHVTLFNRNTNSLMLTAEGKIFAESAGKMIDEYENLCLKMSMLSAEKKESEGTEYNIFATPYILNYLLADIYEAIRDSFPDLSINFYEKSPEEIMISLPTNISNTICITNIPSYMLNNFKQRTDTDLIFTSIFQATLMAKVSPNSLLAHKKILLRQELKQQSLAILSDEMIVELLSYMLNDSELANVVIKTFNQQIIDHKIYDEEIVGFTDTYLEASKYANSNFVAIPIKDSVTMFVGFIYSRNNPPSHTTLELAEFINRNFPAT